jgi:TRIAD3 protein (E3 ubiquitin-protein ligase RNF216)
MSLECFLTAVLLHRECRKPSHIPLRCEEVEHDEETRMRTFVEERMAEALIRTCPTCRSRCVCR